MTEKSSAAAGCLGLVGIFLIASCVFGGSGSKPIKAEPEAAAAPVEAPAVPARSEPPSTDADASGPDSREVAEAKQTVAYIIGLNGYNCLKVTDVEDASAGVYDVTCVTDHHGHHAIFMVNSRTNDVARI